MSCAAFGKDLIRVRRSHAGQTRMLLVNFGESAVGTDSLSLERARLLLESRPGAWSPGALAAQSAVVLATEHAENDGPLATALE